MKGMEATMWHGRLLGGLILLGGAGLLGCHEGPWAGRTWRSGALEQRETSVILDKTLRRAISVDAERADRTEAGALTVVLSLRNRLREGRNFEVQCVFKGAGGAPIGDETAWKFERLQGNETRDISMTSIGPGAQSYVVRIRESHGG